MKHQLGHPVRDVITGFAGIVTGRCEYITGCNQYLVQPKGEKTTERLEPHWFDEQRLEVFDGMEPIVLDNGSTPGPDKAAPIR